MHGDCSPGEICRFWIWHAKYYTASSDFNLLFLSTHVCNVLVLFSWIIVHSNQYTFYYDFSPFKKFYTTKSINMRECGLGSLIYHFCSSNSKVLRAEVGLQKREVFEWTALPLRESFGFCELLDVVPNPFPCRIQS